MTKTYLMTKTVTAEPMTRLDYNLYRNWTLPEDENGADTGFLIKDVKTGHVSWLPTEEFISNSSGHTGLNFGQAVELAKAGHRIARSGWNGKGMFAYIVPENSYPAVTEAIKGQYQDDLVPYNAYWALKGADQTVSTWAPSGSDSLAEDWMLV